MAVLYVDKAIGGSSPALVGLGTVDFRLPGLTLHLTHGGVFS